MRQGGYRNNRRQNIYIRPWAACLVTIEPKIAQYHVIQFQFIRLSVNRIKNSVSSLTNLLIVHEVKELFRMVYIGFYISNSMHRINKKYTICGYTKFNSLEYITKNKTVNSVSIKIK
jgi:hypothetical protein